MQTFAAASLANRKFKFRLSLRNLMLLVLVVGGGLGWVAVQRQREARRQWVVATIQGSLASIDYDAGEISRILWFGGSIQPDTLAQIPLTQDQVEALGSCDRLKEFMIVTSVMTDEALAALSHNLLLEKIYILKPKITDAGVKHLDKLKQLKRLELLRVPDLTDESLSHISQLPDLEELTFSFSGINGSGLAHLAKLENLRTLVIPGSNLDDAGLANPETSVMCSTILRLGPLLLWAHNFRAGSS